MKKEFSDNRTSKNEGKKESPLPNSVQKQKKDGKINSQSESNPEERKVILEYQNEDWFLKSKIGFSVFSMDGAILTQIMKELRISNVLVKEISCWKFLFTFASLKERDSFGWKVLKDWIECVRNPSEEDLIIKSKITVEVRELPVNAWTETNLK